MEPFAIRNLSKLSIYSINSMMILKLLFIDLEGGKFFFNTVREGDSVLFATEDEQVSQTFCSKFQH